MTSTEVKKVPYVRLGNSGLKVSKIILGCMSYGSSEWSGWTFDTANTYSWGESEVLLGKAIKELKLPRDELVILTKVFFPFRKGAGTDPDANGQVNQHGLSRKHIFDSVKLSLERLQLDYIDVLQCHRFDPNTPIEETMQVLHDVVQAGWVRYIGMSSCHAYQFHAMQNYAITNKLTPFISMQNHYNLAYREEEREMFPTLKMFGVGSIPWSPLARGFLCRPLSATTTRSETDQWYNIYKGSPGGEEIVNRVEEISKKKGVTMAQIATAWVLAKDGVSAPIVGTTSLKNLEELIAAVHISLSEEELKYLEEAYKPSPVIGHM
ncbi:hypothetical protein QCA50_004508 [Cerrena zonata]|uniref:NADP-dependent oxidoreductase domain-containing protein n=1 Tax=Cerrena zonata TaxID=2478898 RepID=A0AAW0GHP0_9APHY